MQQVILTYDGSFEGFLTCVFVAYEQKLQVVGMCTSVNHSAGLFPENMEVLTECHKAERVWDALKKKTSGRGLKAIQWAFLSELEHVELELSEMIRYIFSRAGQVDSDYSHPAVLKITQTAKKVAREKHRMEAFIRFKLTKDNIYFSKVEPDFNVLPLIAKHFKDRYADQKWIIYDLKRNYGISYDLAEITFMTMELDVAFKPEETASEYFDAEEIKFQQLWRSYFDSVNIQSRKNSKLHLQHLPKRYWKYLTEKNL